VFVNLVADNNINCLIAYAQRAYGLLNKSQVGARGYQFGPPLPRFRVDATDAIERWRKVITNATTTAADIHT